jgi:hypothetical protein
LGISTPSNIRSNMILAFGHAPGSQQRAGECSGDASPHDRTTRPHPSASTVSPTLTPRNRAIRHGLDVVGFRASLTGTFGLLQI